MTNEQFISASKDQNNRNIINKVLNRYYKLLSKDELYSCGLYALWRALRSYNPSKGRTFSSYLWQMTDWECKR